jgi:hypothetical protein
LLLQLCKDRHRSFSDARTFCRRPPERYAEHRILANWEPVLALDSRSDVIPSSLVEGLPIIVINNEVCTDVASSASESIANYPLVLMTSMVSHFSASAPVCAFQHRKTACFPGCRRESWRSGEV